MRIITFRVKFGDNIKGPTLKNYPLRYRLNGGSTKEVITDKFGQITISEAKAGDQLSFYTENNYRTAGFSIGSLYPDPNYGYAITVGTSNYIDIDVYRTNQIPSVTGLYSMLNNVKQYNVCPVTYKMMGPVFNNGIETDECPACNKLSFKLPITIGAKIISFDTNKATFANGVALRVYSLNDSIGVSAGDIPSYEVDTKYIEYDEAPTYSLSTSGYCQSSGNHYGRLVLGDGTVIQDGLFTTSNFPTLNNLTYKQVNGAIFRLSKDKITESSSQSRVEYDAPDANPAGYSTTALTEASIGDI